MPNPNNPLPPFPPPQPGDQSAQLNAPNELAISQFLYTAGPGAMPLPLPPPPTSTLRAGIHFEYAVSKTLAKVSGLRCSPVCGIPGTPGTSPQYLIPNDPTSVLLNPGTPAIPGTPMSVTRETAPWGKMAVRWRAARNNGAPVIPSEDLGDPNLVLERSWITFAGIGFMADGTDSMVVEGLYIYWTRVNYSEVDEILTAAYPGTGSVLTASGIQSANYSRQILGPNLPPTGAPTNKITF